MVTEIKKVFKSLFPYFSNEIIQINKTPVLYNQSIVIKVWWRSLLNCSQVLIVWTLLPEISVQTWNMFYVLAGLHSNMWLMFVITEKRWSHFNRSLYSLSTAGLWRYFSFGIPFPPVWSTYLVEDSTINRSVSAHFSPE